MLRRAQISHVDLKKYGNVACSCRLFFPLSHVEFKKKAMSHFTMIFSPCRMSLSPMSHVEFKIWLCRPVDFTGEGPLWMVLRGVSMSHVN